MDDISASDLLSLLCVASLHGRSQPVGWQATSSLESLVRDLESQGHCGWAYIFEEFRKQIVGDKLEWRTRAK